MDILRIGRVWNIKMADLFHDSDKQRILFVGTCRLEALLTSMILPSVMSHLPWVKTDPFKQAITSMANPLFTLLLTEMFGYVKGCLISLCLHRVSLRVTTLCTAGVCLASKVKPGSLWNLTKASSGKGGSSLLFGDCKAFSVDTLSWVRNIRSQVSSYINAAAHCNLKSVKISVPRCYLTDLDMFPLLYFSQHIKNRSSQLFLMSSSIKADVSCVGLACTATFFLFLLNSENLTLQTGAEWKDFKMRL